MTQGMAHDATHNNAGHRMNPNDIMAMPGLPHNSDGPVFTAPWQAQAFAMTLALHEKGVFTWPEWATALSTAIRAAQDAGDPDLGNTYYVHWTNALESLIVNKGLGNAEQIHALEHAWANAAERTPHGRPIELSTAERALVLAHAD